MNEARRTRAAVRGGDKIVAPSCELSIAKRARTDRELVNIRLISTRAVRSRDFQRQWLQISTISLIIAAAESNASPRELLKLGIMSRRPLHRDRCRRSRAWRTFMRSLLSKPHVS